MTSARDLLDRIAQREQGEWPWVTARRAWAARVEELQAARFAVEAAEGQARQEAGRARAALESHLKTAAGDDFDPSLFAGETARLEGIYGAWVTRINALASLVEHARRKHRTELDADPAPQVKASHIQNLRAIMAGNAPKAEKIAAWKELQRIDDERPRIEVTYPPGLDLSKYDAAGNLKR